MPLARLALDAFRHFFVLRACSQGIAKLHFDDDLAIHAMYSAEDERVELAGLEDGRRINPKDAKGNVEVWLLQVEVRIARMRGRPPWTSAINGGGHL